MAISHAYVLHWIAYYICTDEFSWHGKLNSVTTETWEVTFHVRGSEHLPQASQEAQETP
jgi:hypothetical protein